LARSAPAEFPWEFRPRRQEELRPGPVESVDPRPRDQNRRRPKDELKHHGHHHCFLVGTRILTQPVRFGEELTMVIDLVDTLNVSPVQMDWTSQIYEGSCSSSWHKSVARSGSSSLCFAGINTPVVFVPSPGHSLFVWHIFIPVQTPG